MPRHLHRKEVWRGKTKAGEHVSDCRPHQLLESQNHRMLVPRCRKIAHIYLISNAFTRKSQIHPERRGKCSQSLHRENATLFRTVLVLPDPTTGNKSARAPLPQLDSLCILHGNRGRGGEQLWSPDCRRSVPAPPGPSPCKAFGSQ
jgi:hypothetical protein